MRTGVPTFRQRNRNRAGGARDDGLEPRDDHGQNRGPQYRARVLGYLGRRAPSAAKTSLTGA
jgi:hypothetical protein